MIKVEKIILTEGNLLNVVNDKNMYVIDKSYFNRGEFRMEPIGRCEIGNLLSGDIAVIRVTEVES